MNSPDIADNQHDQVQKAYRTLPDVLIHDGRVFIEYEYIKRMMAGEVENRSEDFANFKVTTQGDIKVITCPKPPATQRNRSIPTETLLSRLEELLPKIESLP